VGVFAFETNLLVDTAHGIIVGVEATPARLSQEIVVAKAMLARVEAAFGFAPSCLGANKSYGTGPFLAWLLARGVDPHVPVLDRTAQTDGMFTRESFTYIETEDAWRCPSGHILRAAALDRRTGMRKYLARATDCWTCALKPQYTTGKARGVNVSIHEPARKFAVNQNALTLNVRGCGESLANPDRVLRIKKLGYIYITFGIIS